MNRPHLRIRNRTQAGQTLVLAVISMVVMLGFAAISIDYAFLTIARDELRAAADAAALAGITEIDNSYASYTAMDMAGKNTVAGDLQVLSTNDIATGVYDFDTGQFDASDPNATPNAIMVTARRTNNSNNGPVPVFFATALGFTSAEITVQSVAALDRRVSAIAPNGSSPLVPFLIDIDALGGISGGTFTASIGSSVDFFPDRGSAPGNFGLANLDGGSNGTPELVDWITNGYPDIVEISDAINGLLVEGTPGFHNGVRSAVENRIGDTVVILVYDQVSGNGSNSLFRVRTFCAVEITDVRMTGNSHNRYIRGTIRELVDTSVQTGPGGIINNSVALTRLVQ